MSNVEKGSANKRADEKLTVKRQWEIIADNLHDAGFSLGWVSALDVQGRTTWIVDAHGYGKRFIVRADEKLAEFLELVPGARLALKAEDETLQTKVL